AEVTGRRSIDDWILSRSETKHRCRITQHKLIASVHAGPKPPSIEIDARLASRIQAGARRNLVQMRVPYLGAVRADFHEIAGTQDVLDVRIAFRKPDHERGGVDCSRLIDGDERREKSVRPPRSIVPRRPIGPIDYPRLDCNIKAAAHPVIINEAHILV